MTNKEIARSFNLLASLMELHGDNPFKIRSYQNTYIQLRKFERPLGELTDAEISELKGVGAATSAKIRELLDKGTMDKLEEFKAKTPQGIQDMMGIRGLGPKKIKQLWKELGVESAGELLYACNENRLVSLNGFGYKTQEDIRKKLEYFQQSRHKFLFASVEKDALELKEYLKKKLGADQIELTGKFRRKCIILEEIDLLVVSEQPPLEAFDKEDLILEKEEVSYLKGFTQKNIPVRIFWCNPDEFASKLFITTGSTEFIDQFPGGPELIESKEYSSEEEIFEKSGIQFIEPEQRESGAIIARAKEGKLPELISEKEILSVIHNHTTYSDGLHSLREMAEYTRDQGYEFIGITDHSKTAFYANGLQPERVLEQMEEIDALNEELKPFKIFKGIESDILYDGSLDYENDILEKFDFIIASVHSQLKMDEQKATSRIVAAIQNPYTTMLGHPTSRLLLAREGYPLDHKKVIDECAKNDVIIEINANPLRLDLDWKWVEYALEKGVKISINPDAHSKEGIHYIKYGVFAGRKGGLHRDMCFNCLNLAEVEQYFKNRKKGFF